MMYKKYNVNKKSIQKFTFLCFFITDQQPLLNLLKKLAQISEFSGSNIFISILCNNIFFLSSFLETKWHNWSISQIEIVIMMLILKQKNSFWNIFCPKAYSEPSQAPKMELLAKKLTLEIP